MNKIKCPLCHSTKTRLVEIIHTSEIKEAYLNSYGVTADFQSNEISYVNCSNCELHFFDPITTGDEKFYEQLQKFDWYYMTDKPEYSIAKRFLPASGQILEVGSGKAAFAQFVGKDRYVGLEFNDEAISRAKSIGIKLIKESIENHAVKQASQYAAVISFQVLEHISSPFNFIEGCIDSLKEGGYLILAVPNHDGICGLAQNSVLDLPPHHLSHWSETTMRHIAKQYHLDIVSIDVEAVADFHIMWGARALYERKIREFLGLNPKLLDMSLLSKLIGRFSSILARIRLPNLSFTNGHTILACYRKNYTKI